MTTTLDRGSTLAEVADALRNARRVTAICHENPDADTIGAAIAVAIMAERLGAEVEIVSIDEPAPLFAFLPRIESIRRRPQLEPDLAVVCDAATLQRVGRIATEEAAWFTRARLLNVDHHVSSDYFGDLNLVDPYAAATCEVLARLVPELGVELDSELATPLLTGIVRDSHGFSDPSTSGGTLRLAGMLVDAGAPLAQIHRYILAEMPYPMMALWGRILGTMGQELNGRVVYATLTQQMLDETGAQQHDADGVVEFMAKAKGADVTMLLRETGSAATRLSVRTSSAVDALTVVATFNGGGHSRRAGATMAPNLSRALLEAVDAAVRAVGP
ncbi:MAG: bifunctional oligoribonuclease/PAP phosphatase NrnA [Chloroflexi bacterium]|nr:bifunctional oligoribonuclease/PAP phosphatase NrnA [Chloroflexota bacterium]